METDTPADEIERGLSAALEKGEHAVFALSVAKGGRVLIPADKIAYVEFGAGRGAPGRFRQHCLGFNGAARPCLGDLRAPPGIVVTTGQGMT